MKSGRFASPIPPVVAALLLLGILLAACDSPESSDSAAPATSAITDAPTAPPTEATSTTSTISTLPTTTTTEPTEFFVAPSGSDDAAGTRDEPWQTLQHAFESLEAGDTLEVADGTYRERIKVDLASGTADRPITVSAAPGAEPVVEGLLWLQNPDYWRFDGLNITWDPESGDDEEHMVKLTDGVGWDFVNAEVWGARSFANLLIATTGDQPGEPSDWLLAGNCIHDTIPSNDDNEDQLVYANTGPDDTGGTIENNLIFGAENGSGIKLGGPSPDSGGAAGIVVKDNTILDTVQGMLLAWTAHDNLITGNLFAGVDEDYGNLRGYQLDGEGNVARGNASDPHDVFILNDSGYTGIVDGGGNVTGIQMAPPPYSCGWEPGPGAGGHGADLGSTEMPGR